MVYLVCDLLKGRKVIMELLVLDDEKYFLDEFEELIGRMEIDVHIKAFEDENELLDHMTGSGEKPDCLFTDIRLGEANGIDTAQKLHQIAGDIPVVFVTGYPQQYCQSIFLEHFDFEPFAFVCKPVDEAVLKRVFEKLEEKGRDNSAVITLHSGRKDIIVRVNDITYIESNKWYVIVHTVKEEIHVRAKMSDLCAMLPDKFVATHKSYTVNADRVRSFDSVSATLDNGEQLPISRSHKNEFRSRILAIKGFR